MTLLQKTTEFFNQPRLWIVVALLSLFYGYHQRYYYDSMGQFILALVVCVFASANYNSSRQYQIKKQQMIQQQEEEIDQFWNEVKTAGAWDQKGGLSEEVVKQFADKFKFNSHWEQVKQDIVKQLKYYVGGETAEKNATIHHLLTNAATDELRGYLKANDPKLVPDNLLLTVQAFYRLNAQTNG